MQILSYKTTVTFFPIFLVKLKVV